MDYLKRARREREKTMQETDEHYSFGERAYQFGKWQNKEKQMEMMVGIHYAAHLSVLKRMKKFGSSAWHSNIFTAHTLIKSKNHISSVWKININVFISMNSMESGQHHFKWNVVTPIEKWNRYNAFFAFPRGRTRSADKP